MTANRLAREKSPYLLQHAHNPVDWFPWGPEAFSKARAENKPIFLSSGYSTCHWCHVMERESFENPATADLLNRHFVSIKLDREERPDVDRVYMTFVQATTGSGGWPLSVFLTPDLKPFYGGTYFPPEDRHQRPGFPRLLAHLAEAWQSRRPELTKSSIDITAQLESYVSVEPAPDRAAESSLEACFHSLRRSFDHQHAGFGSAPKFPRPSVLNFLLRYFVRSSDELARDMVLSTLRAMARGGMCDQLGGGFHRYSVDAQWHVPHFEKMLYDQAQLAVSLLEAFQLSHDPEFSSAARATLDYVLRDMSHPAGAFYSAEDADSAPDPALPAAKSEGAFYLWSQSEIESLLDPASAAAFCRAYGVRPNGNVSEDPHGEFTAKNILFQFLPADPSLDAARATLLAARALRPRPHLDDKILTSPNALMISAFVKGAQVLSDPRYALAAQRAFDFLEQNLINPASGNLLRRYRDGQAAIDAFLDDYAALALAALDLHSLTFDPRYLDRAQSLAHRMIDLFEDPIHGAFFSAPESHSDLILRMKEDYDGAEPSGNSLAATLLIRLARLTANPLYQEAASRTLIAFASRINQQSPTIPQMMCAYLLSIEPHSQLQLSGDATPLLAEVHNHFLPFTELTWSKSQAPPQAVLCHDFVCRPPVSTVDQLRELLN